MTAATILEAGSGGRRQTVIRRSESEAPVADRLMSRGLLDRVQLDRVCQAIAGTDQRLAHALIALGAVPEEALADACAEATGLPRADAAEFPEESVAADRISARFLRRVQAAPIREGEASLTLAMVDPTDQDTVDAVALATGKPVQCRVALASEIARALDRLYPLAIDPASRRGDPARRDEVVWEDQRRLREQSSDEPVIQLVNQMVKNAVDARASDVHLEASDGRLAVRYRIDGVLREEPAPPAELRDAIVSRVKIGARLDIGERRLPQDGRMRVTVHGRNFDLRVATMPSIHGESIVIRLLESAREPVRLEALGFDAALADQLARIIQRPNGIVLATGPTGSGKTTTLYAFLNHLNSRQRKILTVEDPVEYEIAGVTQVAAASEIGMTFARALRGFLRFDPDVLLVGEIRDSETANVAIEMALVGRLVLSSLHTNDAPGAITRLLDMGVENYLLTSTLRAVIAQRLVRTLCPDCRVPDPNRDALLAHLRALHGFEASGETLFRATGCARCHHTGFLGRAPIAEVFEMSDAVRRAVLDRSDATAIRNAALNEGMRPMLFDGLAKACAGVTTVDEVLRAVKDTHG